MIEASYHSVQFDPALCDGCLACVRACPTRAVRVRSGRAFQLDDRCIDCGECIKACDRRAVRPLTGSLADLSRFAYTVAVPSLALFTQFDPVEAPPAVVLEALRRCGFSDAVGLSNACVRVSIVLDEYLAEYRGQPPVISSFCPTVVRLIQVKYPTLLDQLLPLMSPREIVAREAKREAMARTGLPPERIGIVYVTPCPSKMVELVDHPGLDRSHFDSIVSFRDLYLHLMTAIAQVRAEGRVPEETETAAGLGWSLATGLAGSRPVEDSLAVAGLPDVVRILDDIEKGKLGRYRFVDCHACPDGCASGVLTVEDPYVARARAIRLIRTLPPLGPRDHDDLRRACQVDAYRMPDRIAPRPMRPLHDEIAVAIARMADRDRLLMSLPRLDCAACGAPTCDAFADDVVRGEATEDACVFVRERRVESLVAELVALMGQRKGDRGGH